MARPLALLALFLSCLTWANRDEERDSRIELSVHEKMAKRSQAPNALDRLLSQDEKMATQSQDPKPLARALNEAVCLGTFRSNRGFTAFTEKDVWDEKKGVEHKGCNVQDEVARILSNPVDECAQSYFNKGHWKGNHTVTSRTLAQHGDVKLILGFTPAIDKICGKGDSCVQQGLIRLWHESWTPCMNFQLLYCGMLGKLPHQKDGQIQLATAPRINLDFNEDSNDISKKSVTAHEFCFLSKFCRNFNFDLPVGSIFACNMKDCGWIAESFATDAGGCI